MRRRGSRHSLPSRRSGALLRRSSSMGAAQSDLVLEETFGPIIPIVRVPDDDEATIALSNSTAFGLSSGVCTNDYAGCRNT